MLRTAAAALAAVAAVASCGSTGLAADAQTGTSPGSPSETVLDDQATAVSSSPGETLLDDQTQTLSASPGEALVDDQATAVSLSLGETLLDDQAGPDFDYLPSVTAVERAPMIPMNFSGISPTLSEDMANGYRQVANPVTIRIPSIQVEAPVIGLGLRDDGSIEVPRDPDETGWWRGGPEPGETGPAVILGHIDSRVGPAVFHRLRDLQAGDAVHVDREDGTTVTYIVESSERHDKDAFPTEAVYGPTDQPTLRLVTCGGVFNRSIRSYEDNFIVFASLA